MRKITLLLVLILSLVSCIGKNEHETIELWRETTSREDNKYIDLDDGWFVRYHDIIVDYKKKTVTLPLEYHPTRENTITIIRDNITREDSIE